MREARTLAVEWEGGWVTPTTVLRPAHISKSTSCLHGHMRQFQARRLKTRSASDNQDGLTGRLCRVTFPIFDVWEHCVRCSVSKGNGRDILPRIQPTYSSNPLSVR